MKPDSPLFFPLSFQEGTPLYRQLYERVRRAISVGLLSPGDRLPSARMLAKELGVARGTIEQAYSLLIAEGYLQARGQAGTLVNPDLPLAPTSVTDATIYPSAPDDEQNILWRPSQLLPFQMGVPAFDAFPRKLWARLGARYLRSMQLPDWDYPAPYGLPALRNAIASYLQVARGIDCTTNQVFITSGWRANLQLAALALLKSGQRVWVEDPGYPPTRQLLSQSGLCPVPITVDREGLNVERGIALANDASMAVVTPAHQSPLSMSLSLPRRQALLQWATEQNAWVMEDDYDGEYRYVSRPLPALASLDRNGRVLYAGTFSKVLFPGIRLAYLVVPQAQIATFEHISRIFFASASPTMTQSIVASFIAEGHFARHIQRTRRLYAERRTATIAALQGILGNRIHIDSQPGGMHLVLRLPNSISDRQLADRLLAQGIAVQPLSRWAVSGNGDNALLASFTNCATTAEPERLATLILAELEQQGS
ncbi:PLP-dependent aminotransferase family protein [Pectobacterium carotovorum]|uniref:MocR-like pyridoxine biosynthesis transcription factor PdxR n=1 Tax=Pectobacterium carotovorum TaxID=554 RepID=UPI0015DF3E32|nr:PLP-dependent aminotransferase family protein [Pectobacterium carotovorum]MBA0180745.1 PLP-dependent aminotransferase family protein [Pectobacterium carotovorum]ULS50946.1 PLP-dependent aminotransferase family protein [Pectobacterium carotovorum]GKV88306.1 GntR family transcriptional regulator [Pectobacterium carotovorum subsp. carotovorum]